MIQVAMIVKNEEKVLENCLKSVKDFEILLCDTGSTDSTVEIARKYANVFEDYKWEKSFCKARNYALSKCKKDSWIISIDADEEMLTDTEKIIKIIEEADHNGCDAIDINMVGGNDKFTFPRIFKNTGYIKWAGDAHNYLTGIKKKCYGDITIKFGYSPTHAQNPRRTLEILEESVKTSGSREKFYLAREYSYFKEYEKAVYWCDEYIKNPGWAGEWSECCLLKARCLWNLNRGEEARDACLQAIKINTNFKEALEFMAELSGPINKKRWLEFAKTADNSGVLFVREKEKKQDYYDELFRTQTDFSRYDEIHKLIGEWVSDKRVLDIGCGRADVAKYIKNYQGFDFSEEAIKHSLSENVWVGDLYDKSNYKPADIYLCLEVLEHIDDLKLISNIPNGEIVFSVPSFQDPSHLRTYDEKSIYALGIDISEVIRFNWDNKWVRGGKETKDFILLVRGIKK